MKVFAHAEPGAPAEEIEVPTPELKGSEVIVRITHSGVCHSDVHCQEGYFDLGDAGQMPLTGAGAEYPIVLGHEIVGEIAAVGPDAKLTPGDTKYIVFPWIGCGECLPCREERENYCIGKKQNLSVALDGGFAREVFVPDERYLIEVGDLDPDWAATLACSGVTTYAATDKILPLDPDQAVLIMGAGGLGLMAISILQARGHENIIVADLNDESLEHAKRMGATEVVNVSGEDAAERLGAATRGRAVAAIDLVNNGATSSLALGCLGTGGILVSIGLFGGQLGFPTTPIALKQLTIAGNFVGSLPQLKELVELAKSKDLPRAPLTHKPLEASSVNESLEALRKGEVRGRIVLVAD